MWFCAIIQLCTEYTSTRTHTLTVAVLSKSSRGRTTAETTFLNKHARSTSYCCIYFAHIIHHIYTTHVYYSSTYRAVQIDNQKLCRVASTWVCLATLFFPCLLLFVAADSSVQPPTPHIYFCECGSIGLKFGFLCVRNLSFIYSISVTHPPSLLRGSAAARPPLVCTLPPAPRCSSSTIAASRLLCVYCIYILRM